MNPQVKEISKEDPKTVCHYCQRSEVNSLEWGPMYQLAGVTVHYFCMLFSAGLSQNGEDDEGILGFLPIDIRKELKRGDKLKCKFCKLPRATIGCSVKNCKASYHYPCGLNKGCVFHFIGNYESYCTQHKDVVEIPLPQSEWDCPICFCEVTEEEVPLWPPCCKKKVFHKRCIMEMAKNHGAHFFKCPLCNDKDIFSVAMRRSGVYLPDRDASWESVPNAFAEHRILYSQCDAPVCLCPKGNKHDSKSESKPWKVVRCGACGAAGIHKRCGNLKNLTWRCPTCAEILSDQRRNESMMSISRIQRHHYDLSSDEEMEERPPVIGIKEVISEAPEVESCSTTTTESSSEEDVKKVIYNNQFRRNLIIMEDSEDDGSDDSSSDDDDSNLDDMFVQSESKLRRKLANNVVSEEQQEIVRDVRKSKKTRPLANLLYVNNVIRNMSEVQKAILCAQETSSDILRKHKIDLSSNTIHKEESWQSRASTFDSKLKNTIVQCCRQNSSNTSSGKKETDNVSNPDRMDFNSPVIFPPIARDNLIKIGSTRKVEGRVTLDRKPEVISESPSRTVKISLKGATTSRPCGTKSSTQDSKLRPLHDDCDRTNIKISHHPISEDDTTKGADLVIIENKTDAKHEETIILDDDDSSSDLEIVDEKLKPTTTTTAFLDMVNKARGNKPPPNIRLGFDDHQNDEIEFVDRINQLKPAIHFSSSRTSALAIPPISVSAAFLRVINNSKEKSHYSGRLSSVVQSKMKSAPDRDVETVELISDDEETAQSSRSANQGESNANITKKCSKKRDRLSPTDPSLTSDNSALRSKRPRK